MNLKMLKTHGLKREELKEITAGLSGDCEPGETKVGPGGLIWVCSPTCQWVLPNPDDLGGGNGGTGDNSGHGW